MLWIDVKPNFHDNANPEPDPDPDPDGHQDDADPHADPTPSFTHLGKCDFFLPVPTYDTQYFVFVARSLMETPHEVVLLSPHRLESGYTLPYRTIYT